MSQKKHFLIEEREIRIKEIQQIISILDDLVDKINDLESQLYDTESYLKEFEQQYKNYLFHEADLRFYLGFYLERITDSGKSLYKHDFYNFNCGETDSVLCPYIEIEEYISKAINVSDLFNSSDLRWSDEPDMEFQEKRKILDKIVYKVLDTNEVTSSEQLKELLLKLFWRFRNDEKFEIEYLKDFRRVLN